jgi:hypothetical protein
VDPQSRAGRRGEEKILDPTGARTPTLPSSSSHSIAIPTALSQPPVAVVVVLVVVVIIEIVVEVVVVVRAVTVVVVGVAVFILVVVAAVLAVVWAIIPSNVVVAPIVVRLFVSPYFMRITYRTIWFKGPFSYLHSEDVPFKLLNYGSIYKLQLNTFRFVESIA